MLQHFLHIEWRYQDDEREEEPAEFILPPVETLTALHELCLMGDLEELQEQLAALAQAEERYRPFVTKIQGFVRQFKLTAIKKLLEEYVRT